MGDKRWSARPSPPCGLRRVEPNPTIALGAPSALRLGDLSPLSMQRCVIEAAARFVYINSEPNRKC
jgi:hypothetical protein